MRILTEKIYINTKKNINIYNLTSFLEESLKKNSLKEGNVVVFAIGSTCSVSTIEYEEGLLKDFKDFLKRIVPNNIEYDHNKKQIDDNGSSHLRATLMGNSITIPFFKRKLVLGIWQQVVLTEFDTKDRKREIIFQFMGI